jgi:hypothetical protein
MNSLKELAEQLKAAQADYDGKRAISTAAKKALDKLRMRTIPNAMEDLGITSVNLDGIGRLGVTVKSNCSTREDCGPRLLQWFEDNDPDIVTETISSSTLKAWVTEQIKTGGEWPQDLINFGPYSYASITKAPK